MTEITRHPVLTRDGWRLSLTRRVSRGPSIQSRHFPVLLLHGLGANRSIFDLDEEHSLARRLADEGYETWTLELRGHGASVVPRRGPGSKPLNWCFDDYLQEDLPAAIELIRSQSGASKIHWIGHSMGGLLLLAFASSGKQGCLRSGVTIGSSLDYSGSRSAFHALLPFRRFARWLPPFPLGSITKGLARLGGRFSNPLEGFFYRQSNTDPQIQRAILARSFHVIPVPLLLQLATAFEKGGLCSVNGDRYLDGLKNSHVPLFMMIGEKDVQCPPEAGEATFQWVSAPGSQLRIYGRSHGHQDDYGHFDLLLGKRSELEVFPDLLSWLASHDHVEDCDSEVL